MDAMALPDTGAGRAAAEVPAPALQFLCFMVAAQRCAARIDAVREILELMPTTPLPLMPEFVRGVMNLRGAVVPVIDLSARLGFGPSPAGRRSCIVIADVASTGDDPPVTLGMLVDAVHEVVSAGPHELEPVPRFGAAFDAAYMRQMVRIRDRATPELALDRVLDPQALSRLITPDALH